MRFQLPLGSYEIGFLELSSVFQILQKLVSDLELSRVIYKQAR